MRLHLLQIADDIRASYWFVPTLMVLASLVLAFGLVILDARLGDSWLGGSASWLYASRPEGARQVLATIAGSMITVAGVVFSLTIAAVSYAAGQYGPRLLTNFMRDRGNQVTLGTFIGTFLYCIVVLRTIRSAEETAANPTQPAMDSFVPNIALFAGIGLALASIAVLIYFIHHVTQSISINVVVARIGHQIMDAIGERFPAFVGEPAAGADIAPSSTERGVEVRPSRPGYIEAIDDKTLLQLACEHDCRVRLVSQPGDFVHLGHVLMRIEGAGSLSDGQIAAFRRTFAVGDTRTPLQDLRFLINELAEISARALSPGVNDPFTATACLDWLAAAAADLGNRETPDSNRIDEQGVLRVVARPFGFAEFVDLAFARVRQYVAGDRNAALHTLERLGSAGAGIAMPRRRELLRIEAEQLAELSASLLDVTLRAQVAARAAEIIAQLKGDPPQGHAALQHK